MPKSSSSYTQLPSSSSALLKEDGIEAERAMKRTFLQTPLRISSLYPFQIHPSTYPSLPCQFFYSTQIPVCPWVSVKNEPVLGA
jgi:hypothetical protein